MSQTQTNIKLRRRPRAWLFALLFFAFGSWAANEVSEYIANADDAEQAEIASDADSDTEMDTEDAQSTVDTPDGSIDADDSTETDGSTETDDSLDVVDGINDVDDLDSVEDIVIESNAEDGDLEYLSVEEIMSEDETAEPTPSVEATDEEEDAEFVNLDEILYGTTDEEEITRIKTEEGDIEPPTRQSLESEMQSLKQEVLTVNRDLFILEEDLLFPSGTQVNVFVSIDASDYFSLDGVTLKINNRPISNHLYTKRELDALYRGAVQRLYTGNLPTGEHELVAVVTGQGPEGRDFRRAVSVDFAKNSGTKYVELKIKGDDLRKQPLFQLKEWD